MYFTCFPASCVRVCVCVGLTKQHPLLLLWVRSRNLNCHCFPPPPAPPPVQVGPRKKDCENFFANVCQVFSSFFLETGLPRGDFSPSLFLLRVLEWERARGSKKKCPSLLEHRRGSQGRRVRVCLSEVVRWSSYPFFIHPFPFYLHYDLPMKLGQKYRGEV